MSKISIITPVYNEEASLPLYVEEVRKILFSRTEYEFEVVFIEDGSRDRSWEILKEICRTDGRFRAYRLSRNYGSHIAITAGFARVTGDAIAVLACDLQDPPEVVLEFIKKWKQGAKIVWGWRKSREDRTWRVWASGILFHLLRRFAMPRGSKFTTGTFLLVDRQVGQCFLEFSERHRITFALVAWTGFEQAIVEYCRKQRVAGVSGWRFSQMIKTMYDAFIGFSPVPIQVITRVGVGISIFNVFFGIYLLYQRFTGNPVLGWTALMLAITAFFGIQFLILGVLGEYLYRIYSEVVRRPLYFIGDKTQNAG